MGAGVTVSLATMQTAEAAPAGQPGAAGQPLQTRAGVQRLLPPSLALRNTVHGATPRGGLHLRRRRRGPVREVRPRRQATDCGLAETLALTYIPPLRSSSSHSFRPAVPETLTSSLETPTPSRRPPPWVTSSLQPVFDGHTSIYLSPPVAG